MCGFKQSTETHVRVAPISSSSFFLSLTSTRYEPRYMASRGPMTDPLRTYTWDASCTPTTCAFSASFAGFTVLGMSTFAGAACSAHGGC